MNETELIERAKNNDEKALSEIFVKNKIGVFYMIYQMVNDYYVAEDLTMETFEKAFKDIKKFVPRYRIGTWISKIGKNHTIDYLRFQALRPKLVEFDYDVIDHQTPEKELIGQEQACILETIVANMNEGSTKHCINLWIEGKSCKEISETLGLPMGTVSPSLRRARIKINEERKKHNQIKITKL